MTEARVLKLSTGFEVPLDGDLLAIIEALYKEITLGEALNSSFETMRAEVVSLIEQMSDDERRAYLAESLFLNSVTYENEMLSAYVRKLGSVTPQAPARKKTPARRPSAPRVRSLKPRTARDKKRSKPAPKARSRGGRSKR